MDRTINQSLLIDHLSSMAGIQRGFRTRLTFLSTFNRESHYPIFSALCNCLSIASIVSLTRTCKELSGLYQYLLLVQWDVDKALGRYVDDPPGFRSQMARCDALIDGDFSLHYFERTQGDCEPLDVSIQQGSRVELFSKYLLDIAGYSELERKQHGEIFDTIEVLFTMKIFTSNILANAFAITEPDLQAHGQQ